MKNIYIFTLEDDEIPSNVFNNNVKIIIQLIIEEIKDIEYNLNKKILVINNSLLENTLYEKRTTDYIYTFESEKENIRNKDKIYFNPMIINNNKFGITIMNNYLDKVDMISIVDNAMKLLNVKYRYSIEKIDYNSINIDDESNRKKAIKESNISNKKIDVKIKRRIPILNNFI